MPKIYLSPSVRACNKCICGDNEQLHSRQYSACLAEILEAAGAECRINSAGTRFGISESNIWGADIYYAVRTSGRRGKRGSVLYIGKAGDLSKAYRCAALIKKHRKAVYTGPVRINTVQRFLEAAEVRALCICDDIICHNSCSDAVFFHKNMREIAQAAADGILEYISGAKSEDGRGEATEKALPRPCLFEECGHDAFRAGPDSVCAAPEDKENGIFCECCADELAHGGGRFAELMNMSGISLPLDGCITDEEEELISGIGPFPEDNGEYISILP